MIEYLQITIKPWAYENNEAKRLEIIIKTSRKPEVSLAEVHRANDLVSFFDQIFDCAKQKLLQELKDEG